MTIIILTIIATFFAVIGLGMLAKNETSRDLYQLVDNRCQSIIGILAGIFILLLALVFKLNPFW